MVLAFQTLIDSATGFLAHNARVAGVVTTRWGLLIQAINADTGAAPSDDDVALIDYEDRLLDDIVFDKPQQLTLRPVAGVVPGSAKRSS